jgi:DNA-binding helix-hairpin-helix protein with protein kinase domain
MHPRSNSTSSSTMHHVQINGRPCPQCKAIRLGALSGENPIVTQTMLRWRFDVKRHKVTAHRIEEIVIVSAVAQTHGFEVPERVVEVGGEVGEGG